MKFKTQKGSISLLVLITVLFYSSFLLLLYAKNLNKTTTLVEKVRNMKTAYINSTLEDAYEQVLNKNTQKNMQEISSKDNKDTSSIELNNIQATTLTNYRIYGNENKETENNQNTNTVANTTTTENIVAGNITTENVTMEDTQSRNGVGDLITDEADANNGKYKIEIKVTNKSGETYSKYIYLNKPLLSGEYIDYATKKVVRNDNTVEDIELPEITTYNEYTKIEVITKTKTPELKITYKK